MSSEKIMEVVVEELRKWPTGTDEITAGSRLEEDLGLDMLDRVEVVMDLEDEFGIRIDAEDNELKTVGDLVKAVEEWYGYKGDGAATERGGQDKGGEYEQDS